MKSLDNIINDIASQFKYEDENIVDRKICKLTECWDYYLNELKLNVNVKKCFVHITNETNYCVTLILTDENNNPFMDENGACKAKMFYAENIDNDLIKFMNGSSTNWLELIK